MVFGPIEKGVRGFMTFGGKDLSKFRTEFDEGATQLEHGDELRARIRQGIAGVSGRQAPQAAQTQIAPVSQYDPSGQFRSAQTQLASRLQGILGGQEAGAGELAARRQGARNIANQMAMARMGRGQGAGLAARTAARNVADIGTQTSGLAQEAALRDQQMAAAQLGNVLSTGRAADVRVGLANMDAQNQRIFQQAQLDQATSLANAANRLKVMGMNDMAALQYLSQLTGLDEAELGARMQQEGLKVQENLGLAGVDETGIIPFALEQGGRIATAAATSDRRAKTNIREAKDVDRLLERLKAYSYEYKDKADGEGRREGVMAQDLEKSKLGRRMVQERDGKKVVNYGQGFSTMMASIARLNERLKEMEAKG